MCYFDTTPKFLKTRMKNQKKKKKWKTISKATMMSEYLITEKCPYALHKLRKKT